MARKTPGLDDAPSGSADDSGSETVGRRSYLKLAGAAAAALGTTAGVSSAAPDGVTDGMDVIELDYAQYGSPSQVYNVNDNRSGIPPEFVSSPTNGTQTALRTEFSGAQKTANLEYRFEENGYDRPSEVYTRFDLYPDGIRLGTNDTVRIFWLPLTNGAGSSGGGATDGTNGWSNAIGFAHRNDSPAPNGYNFFSYSYHMDRDGSGDFEMTSTPIWMDQWNEIEGYVRCNTFSNGQANRDGVMRYWINGELAYERTNFRMTTTESNLIEGVGPLGYVVGSNLSGSALIYDNHEIAIGGIPEGRDDTPPYDEDPTLVEPGQRDQYDERLTYRNGDREAEYRIYVDGEIVQSDWSQATYNETVDIATDEYAVVDAVAAPGTVDGYFFDGEIVAISADPEPSALWVSGERLDPSDYPDEPADSGEAAGEEPLENVILVDGLGTLRTSRYEFEVGGDVAKAAYGGASINAGDRIDAGHVIGSVAGWRDAFRFSGDLEQLTVDGPARVLVNGEPVDPADYGDDLPHILTIVGNGSESSYEVAVDGTIDTMVGDASEAEANLLSDSVASGSIETGVHRFRFSGELADFTFISGGTQVYVGDQRIDPDDYNDGVVLPHAIVIDGTEAEGPSDYSFAIDGDVIKSSYRDATLEPTDAVEGASVEGVVREDELDAYWFDGNIADFTLAGDAGVDIYRNVRDVDE
ncbi:hypothetical protein [Haloterrigena alkaliphila]|nr:hypothetical protein [Haloterrigena alkaliphila]QSW99420.2 hypothetical protein J0X25_00235 [Haloterrigena alkaliphila]